MKVAKGQLNPEERKSPEEGVSENHGICSDYTPGFISTAGTENMNQEVINFVF